MVEAPPRGDLAEIGPIANGEELTPAMIAAGADALLDFNRLYEDENEAAE
ncbi:MAG TPA: hypothetical protein VKQ29_14685 [Aliidongia sp.]|nr:hypothetical protein [Aliidongia sp.]